MLPTDKENSYLIVAHPDDEVLWFSSILLHVKQIVICFLPESRDSKSTSIQNEYPLQNARFLSLPQFGAYHRVNFFLPIRTRDGLLIKNSVRGAIRYRKNRMLLQEQLGELIPEGSRIYTHNAWGEYGNEEHVQVHTVLFELQKKKDLSLWHPNYCSFKSLSLMKKCVFSSECDSFALDIDQRFVRTMRDFYLDRHCWTWNTEWEWFAREIFFTVKKGTPLPTYHHTVPINLFNVRW